MPTDPSPDMKALIRQLLAREIGATNDPDAVGTALQELCSRVSDNLRRSLGDDGRDALLERAFTRTAADHPVLADIGQIGNSGVSIDRVAAGVSARGVPPVTAAIETLLATLADILGGLIGADMVMSLLDHDGPLSKAPSGRQAR